MLRQIASRHRWLIPTEILSFRVDKQMLKQHRRSPIPKFSKGFSEGAEGCGCRLGAIWVAREKVANFFYELNANYESQLENSDLSTAIVRWRIRHADLWLLSLQPLTPLQE